MVFIENLVLSGIHGATHKEKEKAQPFRIDIKAVVSPSSKEDDLSRTVDYRLMKRAAEQVVQEESHILLETIAHRIGSLVKGDVRVKSVRITVRKLTIWPSGIPGVSVEL